MIKDITKPMPFDEALQMRLRSMGIPKGYWTKERAVGFLSGDMALFVRDLPDDKIFIQLVKQ